MKDRLLLPTALLLGMVFSVVAVGNDKTFINDKSLIRVSGPLKRIEGNIAVIQGSDLEEWKIHLNTETFIGPYTNGRPKIDWGKGHLTKKLQMTAVDGDSKKDVIVRTQLPGRIKSIISAYPRGFDPSKASNNLGAMIVFGCEPVELHLPTKAERWLAANIVSGQGATLVLDVGGGKTSKGSFDMRHCMIAGLSKKDLKPFVQDLIINGRRKGEREIEATHVAIVEEFDRPKVDDPKLPRCLFIGDSISINYNKALRGSLKGKVNLHHPATNCGPSGYGVSHLHRWMGCFTEAGRGWDVITFNFGHWNSGADKDVYLNDLRTVIKAFQKTGAKLIWVTTAPVPYGFNIPDISPGPADKPVVSEDKYDSIRFYQDRPYGRIPGRMKLQNEWVTELLKEFPDVMVCDQWQMIKNAEDGFFKPWWYSKNVHFTAGQSIPLGRLLARSILKALGKTQEEINAINTLESSESVPDDLNGNRPTTPDSTRIRVATKEMTAAGDARWWAKPALHLDATVVNYDKVFAKSAWDRANVRLKLAEQDLAQHAKWQGTGEVPAEQVAKARRIVEHAKSVLSSTPGGKKGKKKKGNK